MEQWLVPLLVTLLVGIIAFFAGRELYRRKAGRASSSAVEMVGEARFEAQRILTRAEEEARAKADTYREREEATLEHRKIEVGSLEDRLTQREATLEQRAANLTQREELIIEREKALTEARSEAEMLKEEARDTLQRIAGFDSRAAKEELLVKVEDEARRDAMVLVRDIELRAREEAERRARRILATTVQRLAAEVVSETTVSSPDSS